LKLFVALVAALWVASVLSRSHVHVEEVGEAAIVPPVSARILLLLILSDLPVELPDLHVANDVHILRRWQDWHELYPRFVVLFGVSIISTDAFCINDLFRGSWLLVRRVRRGTAWHPATFVCDRASC
jgi:hypothetical protein